MPIHIPNNSRERGSRITNTNILRTGDALELHGNRFLARVAILDSHDPSALVSPKVAPKVLANHHHILVDVREDAPKIGIISAGLYVGEGNSTELFFGIMQFPKVKIQTLSIGCVYCYNWRMPDSRGYFLNLIGGRR